MMMNTHVWDQMPRNSKWYAEYERRVDDFFKREGIDNLGPETDEETGEWMEESFSWHSCDCCASNLGGNRFTCAGYNPTTKEVQSGYSICQDCVYYAEYGQLDDMTMMDMDRLDKEAKDG